MKHYIGVALGSWEQDDIGLITLRHTMVDPAVVERIVLATDTLIDVGYVVAVRAALATGVCSLLGTNAALDAELFGMGVPHLVPLEPVALAVGARVTVELSARFRAGERGDAPAAYLFGPTLCLGLSTRSRPRTGAWSTA